MNLESDKRLIQLRLDFSSAPTGEARQASREDIESLSVVSEPERPSNTLCVERVSVTSRTAVYGPVRTVVWEGRSREAPPTPIIDPSLTSADDLNAHTGLRTSEDDEGNHTFPCQ
jgi:hypothetical protein